MQDSPKDADQGKAHQALGPGHAERPAERPPRAPEAQEAGAGPDEVFPPAEAAAEEPDPDGEAEPAPTKAMPRWKKATLVLAVLAATGVGLAWLSGYWLHAQAHEATSNAQLAAQVAQVSPEVAGHVSVVHVADNQVVERGQVLFEIADEDYANAVASAEADLAAAEGRLEEARLGAASARLAVLEVTAQVEQAGAESERAATDLSRSTALVGSGTISQRTFDEGEASARGAAAELASTERGVTTGEAEARGAEAAIATAAAGRESAAAALAHARLDLDRTRVTAPIAGMVTRLEVEPGDYLSPSESVLSLVGADRWVEANFKETQLSEMRPGQPVVVMLDHWDDVPLEAVVDSIQSGTGGAFSLLPAQNATANWIETVQRVPVKLRLAPGALERLPDGLSLPVGLSVEVEVQVAPPETLGGAARRVATSARGWLSGAPAPVLTGQSVQGPVR